MWRNARRNATFHSARATKQKIHFTHRGETSSLGVTRARARALLEAEEGARASRASRSARRNISFTVFHFSSSLISPSAFLSLSLSLSLSLFLLFTFVSLLVSPLAKIALFLYNARIRRSYCNLVRSRFRVIGEEKYFHGCGAPTKGQRERERERERELFPFTLPPSFGSHLRLAACSRKSFAERKSRAPINSPLERNHSPRFTSPFVSV